MIYTFGVVYKKVTSYSRSSTFSPVLSSMSFIVLHFTFRFFERYEACVQVFLLLLLLPIPLLLLLLSLLLIFLLLLLSAVTKNIKLCSVIYICILNSGLQLISEKSVLLFYKVKRECAKRKMVQFSSNAVSLLFFGFLFSAQNDRSCRILV